MDAHSHLSQKNRLCGKDILHKVECSMHYTQEWDNYSVHAACLQNFVEF